MKKFSFSLQAVLNVRLMSEDLAKQRLAEAQQQLEAEEEKLRVMDSEWMRLCTFAGGDLEQFKHHQYYREVLKDRIEAQKNMVSQEKKVVQQCRDQAVSAEQDRKVLENLKNAQLRKYQQMALLEEQKFLDEIAVLRYTGQKG